MEVRKEIENIKVLFKKKLKKCCYSSIAHPIHLFVTAKLKWTESDK